MSPVEAWPPQKGFIGAVAVVERDARPIVEVRAANTGSQDNRLSLIATVAGGKLRFVSAHASEPAEDSGDPYRLEITQFASYDALQPMGREFEPVATERDRPSEDAAPSPHCERAQGIEASPTIPGNATDAPQPGLTVTSVFEAYPGLSAVRTHTRLRSPEPFSVEAVSSMNLTVPLTVNGGTVEVPTCSGATRLGPWRTTGICGRFVKPACAIVISASTPVNPVPVSH